MEMNYDSYREVAFGDKRINKRLVKELESKSSNPEGSILARNGVYGAKGVYRLLSNEKFDRTALLEGAHRETLSAVAASGEKLILVPQDTTVVDYTSLQATQGLGVVAASYARGFLLHSALAVTETGIVLGLLDQSVITRDENDIGKQKRRKQKKIEEKESYKWLETLRRASEGRKEGVRYIHIADREGDIYALFAAAEQAKETFLIRSVHPRRVREEGEEIEQIHFYMNHQQAQGELLIHVPRNSHIRQKARQARIGVKFARVEVLKSRWSKDKVPESVKLYAIYAEEVNTPEGVEAVRWHLLTNFPIEKFADAQRAIRWYTQRWKIEQFHYVLKSGCKIEKLQESTAEKLEKLTLMYSLVSLRLLWMMTLSREKGDLPCTVCFDEDEWKVLYCFVKKEKKLPAKVPSLQEMVHMLAKLRGFGGRASDGEPGVKLLWQALSDLRQMMDVCAFFLS